MDIREFTRKTKIVAEFIEHRNMSKTVVEFRDGKKMPILVVGTSQGSPRQIGVLVDFALTMGLRHFDVNCSPETETVVGQVLNNWILSGRIRRQDLFITAKLSPYGMKNNRVKKHLLRSLLNLGLNYVDSFIISSPVALKETLGERKITDGQTDLFELWKAMQEIEEMGLTRCLGIAHFSLEQIQLINKSKIKPQILQIEFHPLLQVKEIMEFCRLNKIQVIAVMPPVFTDHETIDFENPLNKYEKLSNMTKIVGRNIEQIIFKWVQQKKCAILCENMTVIHITKCLQMFDFEFTAEQIKIIDHMEEHKRFYIPPLLSGCQDHADYPFK